MHQPKVEFNKKTHHPKLDVQQRIKNSPKERERVFTCFCGKNIDRMEERKTNIYSKSHGEKMSQIKGVMGQRNCKVKV